MSEITGINAIARLADGMMAEAREAIVAAVEQEEWRDTRNDPIAHYCARARRAIMDEAKRNPDGVRKLCHERGLSADETELQISIMQEGAFVISRREETNNPGR